MSSAYPRAWALAVIVGLGIVAGSCAPEFWNGVAEGMASSRGLAGGVAPTAGPVGKLMIFAGPEHKTYLGCLNCGSYSAESVFNENGPHGSPFGVESVMNPYCAYGGPYGMYSPCNRYASDPPVIVDEAGNFYGRLTLNAYAPGATQNGALIQWLETVCK